MKNNWSQPTLEALEICTTAGGPDQPMDLDYVFGAPRLGTGGEDCLS